MFGNGYRRTRARRYRRPEPSPSEYESPEFRVHGVPAGRWRPPSDPVDERVDRLDRAVAGLDPYLPEPSTGAAGLVNPLLVVWDAAQAVHPEVAGPIEDLLTALLHRLTVPTAEVRTAIEETRARALQVLVLEGGALTG